MRPRLIRIDQIWHCALGCNHVNCGLGLTPEMAFKNWLDIRARSQELTRPDRLIVFPCRTLIT